MTLNQIGHYVTDILVMWNRAMKYEREIEREREKEKSDDGEGAAWHRSIYSHYEFPRDRVTPGAETEGKKERK